MEEVMVTMRRPRLWSMMGFLTCWLLVMANVPTAESQVGEEQRIEIAIENSKFILNEPANLQMGVPAVLILRNQDIVRHGFTSAMLMGMRVDAEVGGMAVYGKGIEGFYVDPWEILILRFTPTRPGRYQFHCDIHPEMKGEMFLLEMNTA